MKLSAVTLSLVVLGVFLLDAQALAAENVLSLPIRRQGKAESLKARLTAKRAPLLQPLDNRIFIYTANVTVGTPPQSFILPVDTGSSDTYLIASDADSCTRFNPCFGGAYDSSASSTFKLIKSNGFRIQYADSTESEGDLIKDNFGIGNITIEGLQLGLASFTTVYFGLLGIGYSTNEAVKPQYPNFIDRLVSQGSVGYKAYSLYLDSLYDDTGSILFGGIDTDKYSGPLSVVPLVADNGTYRTFSVTMKSLAVVDGSGNTTELLSSDLDIILDSGTSYVLLPKAVVRRIADLFDAYADEYDNLFVDCDKFANNNGSWTFSIGQNSTIRVPMSEMIFPAEEFDIDFADSPFTNTCKLGIEVAASEGLYLVGDTFLRSAYVVYDLANNQIGIAQTSFDSNSSNIQEIPASASGIPMLMGGGTNKLHVPTSTSAVHPKFSAPAPTTVTLSNAAASPTSSQGYANAAADVDVGLVLVISVFYVLAGGPVIS